MKKTNKIFGTVALSAALALGCAAPAFAANPTTWTPSVEPDPLTAETINDGDAASDVPFYVATNISQINVAVPTKVVFVAESAGGNVMTPSNYKIQNFTTKSGVYVTDIQAAQKGTQWLLTDDGTKVGDGVESTAPFGHIKVEIQSGSFSNTVMPGKNLLADTSGTVTPLAITKAGTNSSDGSTIPSDLAFTFTGTKSSIVNDARTANSAEVNAFDLTYTVSTSGVVKTAGTAGA